jgi:hypothetical protein
MALIALLWMEEKARALALRKRPRRGTWRGDENDVAAIYILSVFTGLVREPSQFITAFLEAPVFFTATLTGSSGNFFSLRADWYQKYTTH